MQWSLAFISLACLIYLTDACLRAETNPAHVDHQVNLRFSIKCTFYPCGGDDITKLVSLQLQRISGTSSQRIGQISNNWYHRKWHQFPFGRYGAWTGDAGNHLFLSAEWTVPYVQRPSYYQCVAVGKDRAGRVHVFKKLALLGGDSRFSFSVNNHGGSRLKQCLAREKTISNERTRYQNELATAKGELNRCRVNQQTLTNEKTQYYNQFTSARGELNRCLVNQQTLFNEKTQYYNQFTSARGELNRCLGHQQTLSNEKTQYYNMYVAVRDQVRGTHEARGTLFYHPLYYGGHRYYVSKFSFETMETAQAICQATGGYLVELDDMWEYQSVRNYILNLRLRAESVLLGGTDREREGTWVFQRTRNRITYFDWLPGEPNNDRKEDCMSLWLARRARMNDIHCWRVRNLVVPFACEVPTSSD